MQLDTYLKRTMITGWSNWRCTTVLRGHWECRDKFPNKGPTNPAPPRSGRYLCFDDSSGYMLLELGWQAVKVDKSATYVFFFNVILLIPGIRRWMMVEL